MSLWLIGALTVLVVLWGLRRERGGRRLLANEWKIGDRVRLGGIPPFRGYTGTVIGAAPIGWYIQLDQAALFGRQLITVTGGSCGRFPHTKTQNVLSSASLARCSRAEE